jgi:uroporphyrinogen decarboxylase
MQYNHRERVRTALSHKEPDRIPFDLGGTFWSSVHIVPYQAFKSRYNTNEEDTIILKNGQIAGIHEAIVEAMDIDFRYVQLGIPDSYQDNPIGDDGYQDAYGIVRRKPPGSFYYDLVRSPLSGPMTIEDIINFNWPDPSDPGITRGLRERVLEYRDNKDYALVLPIFGGVVQFTQYLRGFEDWFLDLAVDERLASTLFDAAAEQFTEQATSILKEVGDLIDVVAFGDDLGLQNGPMISPDQYRRLIKPRHKKILDVLKYGSRAFVLMHCCGSIAWVLDDLIEIGVDAINPVQVSAKDMDTKVLKKKFGDRITFWGGIDTQRVLPNGTINDVKAEVKQRIKDLAEGGGFVLAPVHNIQPGVPAENIIAMYAAGQEWGRYPLSIEQNLAS